MGDFDFGGLDYLTEYEATLFWLIWFFIILLSNIIFLNFIIAEASASYENVISVCAIGCNGNWGGWASYHPTVDLAAPGESIYSAIIGSGYASWNGSSMAGPNAASCIGLYKHFIQRWITISLLKEF